MGHKNKKSLVRQVQESLQAKLSPGDSRHLAKASGTAQQKIYSFNTFRTYQKHACYFVSYCKEHHGCKTLADCRPFVNEYLQHRSSYCSPYTVKLDACSIGKTYGESTTNFAPTPSRTRAGVTRSRGPKAMDRHFSEIKNSNLVDFCRAVGTRRSEVMSIRGSDLVTSCSTSPVGLGFRISKSKGGRSRIAPVFCDKATADRITAMCQAAGSGKIFPKVSGSADIHSYRSDYAERVYTANARDLGTLFHCEKYYCRGDKKGCVYDKNSLKITSQALGHNRVSVVANSYLHSVK